MGIMIVYRFCHFCHAIPQFPESKKKKPTMTDDTNLLKPTI